MNSSEFKDSLIVRGRQQDKVQGFLTKIDLFSFIPVPKDDPVSTKRSMVGSLLFIVIALSYILQDFYFFIVDHPPVVQQYNSNLGFKFYQLPSIAITFMEGQSLNQTGDYKDYLDLSMTKQLKDKSSKLSTQIPLRINDQETLHRWIPQQTTDFYYKLFSPAEQMMARGLLYSTSNCNYTKITIKRCNFSDPDAGCKTEEQIRSKMAQGRVFLFIEQQSDKSSAALKSSQSRGFSIANFFLIPKVYKRVTVTFNVIETQVLPDYFTRWSNQNTTRLQLSYITELTSDVVANAEKYSVQPLQMMGIQFQLAPTITHVRVSYDNLLDRVGKWGGFCNALFTLFAILFLAYNRKKFYHKNPTWNNFKEHYSDHKINNQDILKDNEEE